MPLVLQDLTIDSFRPLIGSEFDLQLADGKHVALMLRRVDSLTEKGMKARKREPFSIVFSGPPDAFLPQQTLPLSHARLGNLAIFVVPIGRMENGFEYEAIFT